MQEAVPACKYFARNRECSGQDGVLTLNLQTSL
jgi:hypothetical protein